MGHGYLGWEAWLIKATWAHGALSVRHHGEINIIAIDVAVRSTTLGGLRVRKLHITIKLLILNCIQINYFWEFLFLLNWELLLQIVLFYILN